MCTNQPVCTNLIDLQSSLMRLVNVCQLTQFRYRILDPIDSCEKTMAEVGLELPQVKVSRSAPCKLV